MSKTKSLVPDEVNAFDELDYTGKSYGNGASQPEYMVKSI